MATILQGQANPTAVPSGAAALAPRIARLVLRLAVGLAAAVCAILLLIPVALMPLTTLVPAPVWILLALADVAVLVFAFRTWRPGRAAAAMLGGFLVVALLAGVASHVFAGTPPIVGADGKPLPNSIATLEKVKLNGSDQWITIRGKDVSKPVLLYLGIGGPGAGGFPATKMNLQPLEEDFVVVNWDQPGTGKSYDAVPISTLTTPRFVEDARVLTDILRARFHQDKIYVFGLSWGTIVGIHLIQQYPDRFYAYVGNGQMVNTVENDRFGYDLSLKITAERGDTGTLETLRRNGPPPYLGDGMAYKYAAYNDVLFAYMGSPSLLLTVLLGPQFAPEYGYWDRVNFGRGLVESYTTLYPQLLDLDFTKQAANLQVPVFFLVGSKDVNAVASIVERYYNVLQAPYKELIWVPSGHGANGEEIRDALVNHVLAAAHASH